METPLPRCEQRVWRGKERQHCSEHPPVHLSDEFFNLANRIEDANKTLENILPDEGKPPRCLDKYRRMLPLDRNSAGWMVTSNWTLEDQFFGGHSSGIHQQLWGTPSQQYTAPCVPFSRALATSSDRIGPPRHPAGARQASSRARRGGSSPETRIRTRLDKPR